MRTGDGAGLLRLYIGRKEGVTTLAELRARERAGGAFLDVEESVAGATCSRCRRRGLDRRLRTLEHFGALRRRSR